MRRKTWIALIIVLVLIAAAIYGIFQVNIAALPGPGTLETEVAGWARGWYVRRAAAGVPAASVPDDASNISAGEGIYGMECASCHGSDGRKPTPMGESMYPRVPNLSSLAVQSLSDKELFWVIENGIRLTGMPGFGDIDSDRELWQVAYYVRSLGAAAKH